MNPSVWEDYKRRTLRWAIRIGFELLYSDAFRSLNYCPSVKVLIWAHEKRQLRLTKRRGRNRFEVLNNDFPFTYAEAKLRGLTHKQFGRALKDLVCRAIIPLFALVSDGKNSGSRISRRSIFKKEQSLDASEGASKEMSKNKINGIFLP